MAVESCGTDLVTSGSRGELAGDESVDNRDNAVLSVVKTVTDGVDGLGTSMAAVDGIMD